MGPAAEAWQKYIAGTVRKVKVGRTVPFYRENDQHLLSYFCKVNLTLGNKHNNPRIDHQGDQHIDRYKSR